MNAPTKPVRQLLAEADRLARAGQLPAAQQQYHAVLARFPGNKRARAGLAALARPDPKSRHIRPEDLRNVQALLAKGQPEGALKLALALLVLEPAHLSLLELIGLCHRRLGQPEKSLPYYERALQQSDSAALWASKGSALMETGHFMQAAPALERAAALAPSNARVWIALSRCRVEMGQPGRADIAADAALTAAPDTAKPLAQKGHVQLLLGHPDQARAYLEKSLALEPQNTAALCHLAGLERGLGRRDLAQQHYANAAARSPRAPALHRNLSMVKDYAPGDPHIGQMQHLLAQVQGDDGRSQLHFALFNAFDQLDQRDLAFEHLTSGNRLRRRFLAYNPGHDAALLPWLRSLALPPAAPPPPGACLPIFITGLPRSGTTLTEMLLARRSGATPAGELPVVSNALAPFLRQLRKSNRVSVQDSEAQDLTATLRRDLLDNARGAPALIDKMPLNFRYLPQIAALLPEARFIHLTRDAMANGWSLFRQCFGTNGNGFCYGIDDIARFTALERTHIAQIAPLLGPRLLQMRYETIIKDPDAATDAMAAHCGLADTPAPADPRAHLVLTASADQVRGPLDLRSNQSWQRYAAPLAPLRTALTRHLAVQDVAD
ncbi:MAG: tetratricopeptide repeat-containing sulfotransferase family protein [Sulfitobacter sp.]